MRSDAFMELMPLSFRGVSAIPLMPVMLLDDCLPTILDDGLPTWLFELLRVMVRRSDVWPTPPTMDISYGMIGGSLGAYAATQVLKCCTF
mmetsp:Transcript_25904/g.48986  ORF Transcript_25904/g.48986 Transcript_25904/m.48986 type:complete len:90 (+) Transcript_25904:1018-1287(+)